MSYPQDTERIAGPYRSRKGIIFGVCRGLAEYYNFSLFWTRFIVVMSLIFSGGWVGVGYIVVALLLKLEPVLPLETTDDAEFYNSYTSSRSMALARLKRTFDSLERRLQRMESIVTDRTYDWDDRLNNS